MRRFTLSRSHPHEHRPAARRGSLPLGGTGPKAQGRPVSAITLRTLFEFSASTVEHAEATQRSEAGSGALAPPTFTGFIASTAADELNKTLDTDVFEMLGQAWLKLKQVRDCADPALRPPHETSVVPLRDIAITSVNTPLLHATVGGVKLPDLRLTLELVAKFSAIDLVIQGARIRSLRPGAASATVKLKYGSIKLVEKATPKWVLPASVDLGEGLAIPWHAGPAPNPAATG